MASRVKRGLLLHLIIQVSDDLQVQCETYMPTLLFFANAFEGRKANKKTQQ